MSFHWAPYAAGLVGCGVVDVAAAVSVWRRRGSRGRISLCVLLLAGAIWSFAYALELTASTSAGRQFWGGLKYVGTTALPPAWLIFALQYSGRLTRVRTRLLAALAVEPLVVLLLLAYPSTRALIRSYPLEYSPWTSSPRLGAAYWPHFVYTNLLVLAGSGILLITVIGTSRLYWRQSLTLLVAICLPLLGNAMSSLEVPPFETVDPSPIAVSFAACVLVYGVLRYRLLDLRPVARALVVDTIRDAVLVIDARGQIVDLNPAAQQLVGRSAATAVGCPVKVLLANNQADITPDAQPGAYDVRFHTGDRRRDLDLTVTPLADPRGAAAGQIWVLRDVSERREWERNLRRLAYTDALTGLPNRALFHDRLAQALAVSRRHGTPLAVFFLDLDGFKIINDSAGHEIGDKVLVEVARRLRSSLRAQDTLARLGGDEFAVLLPEITDPRDTHLVADKLLATLTAPQLINGMELSVDASIGVAVFPQDGNDVRRLLRSADVAMYRAKARGRGRVQSFAPALGEQAARRYQLEVELRRGLRAGQFRLAFQPYHELSTGQVVGYEALVRWNHPSRGLLLPASFLPLAEDTGLIEAVDRWVLEQACRQARQWAAPIAVSVNVSPARFAAGDLHQQVTDTLADTGLHPSRLTLELSERTLFDDTPEASPTLVDLATAGVGLALDDFGAGYTSLGHLRRLPLTQVKIDRSLVTALGREDDDSPIVEAVISFVHTLGLPVTAEGIEQPHQLDRLVNLGCEFGQGFLLGRPQPFPTPGNLAALPPRERTIGEE
jgi:diguanylate cyclase (GGDEF)-like protein/PAS domain S-box-containing protein